MKKISFSLLFVPSVLLLSCSRPEACIKNDYPTTANVGDTVRFERCSENNEVNNWKINDDFLNQLEGFPGEDDHLLIDGGGICDDYLEVQFLKSGTYSIDFKTGRKRSGTCANVEYKSSKTTSVNITINE